MPLAFPPVLSRSATTASHYPPWCPAGVLADYRQIHIAERDRDWLSAGDRWVFHDLPCGRVGLLVGEDLIVPEAGRVLSLEGCDLIAASASLHGPVPMAHAGSRIAQNYPIPTGEDPHHWLLPRVRAGSDAAAASSAAPSSLAPRMV